MTTTNKTFAFLNDQNLSTVEPDQGLGRLGEWPEEGEHACYVTGVTVDDNAVFRTAGEELPGFSIQFDYVLCEDPKRPENLAWKGSPFIFPKDRSKITADNVKTRLEIADRRLAGHIKTLLGRPPARLGDDLQQIAQMLSDTSTSVVAKVQCRYTKGRNDRVYRDEYLQELMSA